jgi:hypothetical protein
MLSFYVGLWVMAELPIPRPSYMSLFDASIEGKKGDSSLILCSYVYMVIVLSRDEDGWKKSESL